MDTKFFMPAPNRLLCLPRHLLVVEGCIGPYGKLKIITPRQLSALPPQRIVNQRQEFWIKTSGPAGPLTASAYAARYAEYWLAKSGYTNNPSAHVTLQNGHVTTAGQAWETYRLVCRLALRHPNVARVLGGALKTSFKGPRWTDNRTYVPYDPDHVLSREPFSFTDTDSGHVHSEIVDLLKPMISIAGNPLYPLATAPQPTKVLTAM